MKDADKLALALTGKNATTIQAAILSTLKERLKQVRKVYTKSGSPTREAMDAQANYIAGAAAALQVMFEDQNKELTSLVPQSWIWKTLRGELVVHPYK